MSRKLKSAFPVIITVAWLLSNDIAAAQRPSALLLEKIGVTNPAVQPYTEIVVGKTITLSPEARIVFQHYHTCRTVTVAGGTINFEAKAYFVKGGQTVKETNTPCPKNVILKVGGEAGGVLMRSMLSNTPPTLPPRPKFVLVGKYANDFASVRVSQGGREVFKSPLAGRLFQWPTEAVALAVDAEYELALIPVAAGAPALKKKFRVSSAKPVQTSQGLVLIRVD